MNPIRALAALFRRKRFEAEMAEEIRLHLEQRTRENVAGGMSPEDARFAALRKFGGVEQMKEVAREQSGWLWLEQLARDLRFSLRSLAKVPTFTVTVITVLALCIGANASVASALHSLLLKPLPFRSPGQLIEVFNQFPKLGTAKAPVSHAQYRDYQENADLFEGFAVNMPWFFTIGEETETVRMVGAHVSTDYFDLWGVVPYRGSLFTREHAKPGTRVVVFAQSFWENYFHADPDIIGKSVRMSGEEWTVLGIAPRAVESIDGRTVAFIPAVDPPQALPRTALQFLMYARLKSGVTMEQGLAQLQTIEQRYLDTVAPPAIRTYLEQGFLLTAGGSLCGLGGGWTAVRVIRSYLSNGDGYEQFTIAMDATIVAVSLLCALGVALLISLLPLLEIWRGTAASASATSQVPDAARSATGNRRMRTVSGLLVTTQVALALIILISAGLLIRSFSNLLAVDLGFRPEKIIFGRMLVPPAYQAAARAADLHDRMLGRIRAIPGVDSAALISNVLLDTNSNPGSPFVLRDAASDGAESPRRANVWTISPDFFATMEIPLVEGRTFTDADRSAPIRPLIIDRKLAERYFPGRSPIGENIGFGIPAANNSWPVIVGVVETARLNGAEDTSGMPSIYAPLVRGPLTLVLRSTRPIGDVLQAVRQEIRATDRALPFYWAGTLEDRHNFRLRHRRGTVLLLGSLGTIALLLSAVGLYGMLAYDVSLRTREIGIRGAIGASRQQIIGLILRQGFAKAAIGMIAGLVTATAVTRYLRSVLFGVEPVDPASFAIVSGILLLVVLFASYLPARRAAGINPVLALKCE